MTRVGGVKVWTLVSSPRFSGKNSCRQADKRSRDDVAEKVPIPDDQ